MKIEIDLPDEPIRKAVLNCWARAFTHESYGGGDGLQIVDAQIKAYLSKPETIARIQAIIQSMAADMYKPFVQHQIKGILRRELNKIVKEQAQSGGLFKDEA